MTYIKKVKSRWLNFLAALNPRTSFVDKSVRPSIILISEWGNERFAVIWTT